MNDTFTIGQVADLSGVPAKTIRYYESIGLIAEAERAPNGYRRYGPPAVETLRFVHRARGLGFSIEDVEGLLELWTNKHRASREVRHIATEHIAAIERKIAELDGMRATLTELVERCHGDDRPDCPILDELGHSHEES